MEGAGTDVEATKMCFHVNGRVCGRAELVWVLLWPFLPIMDTLCVSFIVLLPDLLRIRKSPIN